MISSLITLNEGQINQISPLSLAFFGDSVCDLFVRERLMHEGRRPSRALHAEAAMRVNAVAQAEVARKIMTKITTEELKIFQKGKNAKPKHLPQTCSREEYGLATGLEALLGWLWLTEKHTRIREIMEYFF